jgi:transcriptional repressor NrdR
VRCPYCATDDDRVIDSRPAEDGASIRRRRECRACQQRFTTFERAAHEPLTVRKRDGALEPFRRDKLHLGMARAMANLDLDGDTVWTSAARVEAQLRRSGERIVGSDDIGRAVLAVLRDIHQVAYVRFASVYKGFTTPEDFARELAALETAADVDPTLDVDAQHTLDASGHPVPDHR